MTRDAVASQSPIDGTLYLLCVEVFEYGLDVAVLLYQLQGAVGPDAPDGSAVVAPKQNAQVNELCGRCGECLDT
jgi:hypothetical protein